MIEEAVGQGEAVSSDEPSDLEEPVRSDLEGPPPSNSPDSGDADS